MRKLCWGIILLKILHNFALNGFLQFYTEIPFYRGIIDNVGWSFFVSSTRKGSIPPKWKIMKAFITSFMFLFHRLDLPHSLNSNQKKKHTAQLLLIICIVTNFMLKPRREVRGRGIGNELQRNQRRKSWKPLSIDRYPSWRRQRERREVPIHLLHFVSNRDSLSLTLLASISHSIIPPPNLTYLLVHSIRQVRRQSAFTSWIYTRRVPSALSKITQERPTDAKSQKIYQLVFLMQHHPKFISITTNNRFPLQLEWVASFKIYKYYPCQDKHPNKLGSQCS